MALWKVKKVILLGVRLINISLKDGAVIPIKLPEAEQALPVFRKPEGLSLYFFIDLRLS
jgi:hypothetical protein